MGASNSLAQEVRVEWHGLVPERKSTGNGVSLPWVLAQDYAGAEVKPLGKYV